MPDRLENLRQRAVDLQSQEHALAIELGDLKRRTHVDPTELMRRMPDAERVVQGIVEIHAVIATLLDGHQLGDVDDAETLERIVEEQAAALRKTKDFGRMLRRALKSNES